MNNFIGFLLFIIAGACAQQTYQLVWSDEFNGNSLDTSKWQYEVNCDGGGNNELQCYTANARNVYVNNGSLVIRVIPENYNGRQYTSGRINTAQSAAWKYGRFDARAKLPNGIYLWPALWMMPRDSVYGGWAASGEIDIMENRGGNNHETQSTMHFGGSWPNNVYQGSGAVNLGPDLTADYHIYTAIWTPQSVEFQVDGQHFYTMSLQRSFSNPNGGKNYAANGQPFDQYFYYIMNVAVDGGFFGGNSNALTSAQAAAWANPAMYVDYVRVYQLQDGVANNPTPAPVTTPAASSADCTAMWNSLSCRPTSDNADSGQVNGARTWLCNTFAQYCTDINAGGKYSGCTATQQIAYAMNAYYNDYKASQGAAACSFGGLGQVVSPAAPASTTKAPSPTTSSTPTPTPTPSSSATPCQCPSTTPTPTPTSSAANACPSGQTQCVDANFGSVCFVAGGPFDCVTGDDNKQHLCPKNLKACGDACYPPSQYNCVSGWLSAK